MRNFLIFSVLILLGANAAAQKQLAWPVLGMTTYQINTDENGVEKYVPNFPPNLQMNYDGQEVAITGYLIPIDVEAQTYALSKNPFTSCFFCGNAGPETVIQLKFAKPPGRFATDEYLMVKGMFQLKYDGSGLFFIIKNAEIHG